MVKQHYKKVFHFIGKDMRWIVLGVVAVFIALTVLTDLYFSQNPDLMAKVLSAFDEATKDIIIDGDISAPMLFLNNLEACLIAVALGFIPFLFLPVLPLVFNAAVMGAVTAAYRMSGMSIVMMWLTGILPHGIFELPAVLLSFSMGLFLCYCLVKRICEGRYNKGIVKKALADVLRTTLLLILPLLIAAAAVETYITPVLIGRFFG